MNSNLIPFSSNLNPMKNSFLLHFSLIFLCLLIGLPQFVIGQFNCGDTLIDVRDGQKYATVLIGGDCWFKQNLNYGTMVISDSTGTIHSDQTNNAIPEKYAQENDSNNLDIYGGLYEWTELMNYNIVSGGQGLCPFGWHVSTDTEWIDLISTAGANLTGPTGGNGGNKLKQIGEGWGQGAGTDNVGFSAKHGGDRDGFGIFYGKTLRGIFWTSTLVSPNQAIHYTLWATNDTIQRLQLGISSTGFSCRCVKDSGPTGRLQSGGDLKLGFVVFPNPAGESITIRCTSTKLDTKFEILDLQGKEIMTGNLPGESTLIDISLLVSGLYILKVGNENKVLVVN